MGEKTDSAPCCPASTLRHAWRMFAVITFSGIVTTIVLCIVNQLKDPHRLINPKLPKFETSSELIEKDIDILENVTVHWPSVMSEPELGNYPQFQSLLSAIESWNPDVPEPPPQFRETLQHFDYSNITERAMAVRFRDAELPFKVYNVPEFTQVTGKWTDDYLQKHMRRVTTHTEMSSTNHFLFWNTGSKNLGSGYTPPTTLVRLRYREWVELAKHADFDKTPNTSTHFYFMIGSRAGERKRNFLAKDMPVFATDQPNFFITRPDKNKGIQCRFGMRGIIAESHYDAGRNMVAMIKGAKRYILTPPKTCKDLGIIGDKAHPSYRHSVLDWSDVDQARSRGFDKVDAIDTIIREGEVLYIPSYWFHYIVSLQRSIQCNSRSGSPDDELGRDEIDECLRKDKKARKDKKDRLRRGTRVVI